ncbi:unnamed protein product [Adineta steineri]|uniref:Carboxylesterase type B domain-containing protein n=2 Tax=Adineta steineri TaxID=433720 RepID=A0A818R565_9BILA|nr:unnamed protein product [Adineta steineri]
MVGILVFIVFIFLLNLQYIKSLNNIKFSNDLNTDLLLNTTSGLFQGKQVRINDVPIKQFFGIPYGEKPIRFQMPIPKQYNTKTTVHAIERTPACLQISGGLSYGPFQLSDMFDEDCLTLNIFLPKTKSSMPKAIMVFSSSDSNQIGSASLFDGSAIAAIGDVIVITINYRLNIFGFLTPDTNIMSGNYGLYDQLLALKWISSNAKHFNGDAKRITYVGHSADATNAILLAMSKHSDGIIARVIAQSGCPFHQWSIDRQPIVRFNNVIKQNNMNSKKKFLSSNIEQLKTMAAKDFQYTYQYGLDKSSDYPFPVVDNDLVIDNFEQLIHTGSLVNTDILIGVTADESLYLAEEHIFYNYLPKQNRKNSSIVTNSRSSAKSITEYEQIHGFSYFKKKKFIKNFLKKYHPEYLCFYEEIEAQYMPKIKRERSLTEIAHLYTNLVSDLMIYYDLIRFLRERLQSQSKASTYVYYYTNPAIFNLNNLLQRIPNMVGHFAELDLIWGVPFFNRSNLSYTSDETELSRQMIRYWTNFAKTGNPNEPNSVSVQWPPYEKIKKSYINFHAKKLLVEDNFLEARFQFWNIIAHRQLCIPFYWYHTSLLVGILILTIFLILIYIFFNSKRSRRNIKPTELTTTNIITTYHFLPSVVS